MTKAFGLALLCGFGLLTAACKSRSLNEDAADNSPAETLAAPAEYLKWNNGSNASEPPVEVHVYEPDALVILRQSLRTSFEGPFLYLLLGDKKALLIDTGTGSATSHLVAAVKKYKGDRELSFINTHSHSDHTGGNGAFSQFSKRLSMQSGSIDLGSRKLEVQHIPGHTSDHIAIWDPQTKILFTGDTVYPGYLFVNSGWSSFKNSIAKLAKFIKEHDVKWLMGAHIEFNSAGKAYSNYHGKVHANEHHLELDPKVIQEIHSKIDGKGYVNKGYRGDSWMISSYPP